MAETMTDQDAAALAPPEAEVNALLDELNVTPESNLIAVLQQLQDRFGYLPGSCLEEISRRIKIPLSRIYGVVTFYAQFYTEPHGRYTIRCCCGTVCHAKNAGWVLDAVRRELSIDVGETTSDSAFYLESVACLGMCFLAPTMMIDDRYFGKLTPQRVRSILRSYRQNTCSAE